MDKKKTAEKIISSAGGIAKTSEFVSAGLSNFDVANLCNDGYIERIRHGYYRLAEKKDIKEEQILASLLPEVLFVLSLHFFIMDTAILHQGNGLSLFKGHFQEQG